MSPLLVVCRPTALLRVVFWDGEELQWNPLLTTVNHIIVGKLSISHTGTLHVRGGKGGLASKTVFREPLLAARRMVRLQPQAHAAELTRCVLVQGPLFQQTGALALTCWVFLAGEGAHRAQRPAAALPAHTRPVGHRGVCDA